MKEIWKPIQPGSKVIISNTGKIIGRKIYQRKTGWYKQFSYKKPLYLHRVVYELFVASIPSGYEINHKDSDKSNNCYTNLEAVTHADNMRHAAELRLMNHPDQNGCKNSNYQGGKYCEIREVYNRVRWRCEQLGIDFKNTTKEQRIEIAHKRWELLKAELQQSQYQT